MITNEAYHRVEQIALQHVAAAQSQIKHSLRCVQEGNPLAAEPVRARLIARLMAKNGMTREEAQTTELAIRAAESMTPAQLRKLPHIGRGNGKPGAGAEAIVGGTIDFVGIAFLARGVLAAKAVARVAFRSGQAVGSGFMVSDRLFLTNHHVIETPEAAVDMNAEFDYELDIRDNPVGRTRFRFDPRLFVTDPVNGLDFTLIGVAERFDGTKDLPSFGYCALSDAGDKHALGEVVNIVQHPEGRYKEVVLRENRIVARVDSALLYTADTEPGSSGSPVFNNQWQPVALHHWGGPFLYNVGANQPAPREVNEGVRISALVQNLRARVSSLQGPTREAVEGALRMWESTPRPDTDYPDRPKTPEMFASEPRLNADGSTSYFFPIEISVRAPLLATRNGQALTDSRAKQAQTDGATTVSIPAERTVRPSNDFSDRDGYEPGFIPGFTVPLPGLTQQQKAIAAKNLDARTGENEFELRYHHFSIVVNERRKLAFFAACNIDGSRSKYIDRKTGKIEPLDPRNTDHGLMEALAAEGAESESWFEDSRLAPGSIANQDIYGQQIVPGYSDPRSMGRTLRMFQRGHLARRLDPAWGTNDQAQLAEADTFFFTNASPQVGFFNMGQGAPNTPGTGGGKLWRAVENLVLRNARTMRTRVCSFTGPIFDDRNDRPFRTVLVPGRFFKIAVWAQDGQLRSLGMIADQRPVIRVWPERLFKLSSGESLDVDRLGAEAFQDPDELNKVDDFLTTIAVIEHETGLDFGKAVRDADIRRGESEREEPESLDDVILKLNDGRHRGARSSKRPAPKIDRDLQPAKEKKESI